MRRLGEHGPWVQEVHTQNLQRYDFPTLKNILKRQKIVLVIAYVAAKAKDF